MKHASGRPHRLPSRVSGRVLAASFSAILSIVRSWLGIGAASLRRYRFATRNSQDRVSIASPERCFGHARSLKVDDDIGALAGRKSQTLQSQPGPRGGPGPSRFARTVACSIATNSRSGYSRHSADESDTCAARRPRKGKAFHSPEWPRQRIRAPRVWRDFRRPDNKSWPSVRKLRS